MVVTRTYLCPLRGNHSNPNHICKRLRHKTLKLLKRHIFRCHIKHLHCSRCGKRFGFNYEKARHEAGLACKGVILEEPASQVLLDLVEKLKACRGGWDHLLFDENGKYVYDYEMAIISPPATGPTSQKSNHSNEPNASTTGHQHRNLKYSHSIQNGTYAELAHPNRISIASTTGASLQLVECPVRSSTVQTSSFYNRPSSSPEDCSEEPSASDDDDNYGSEAEVDGEFEWETEPTPEATGFHEVDPSPEVNSEEPVALGNDNGQPVWNDFDFSGSPIDFIATGYPLQDNFTEPASIVPHAMGIDQWGGYTKLLQTPLIDMDMSMDISLDDGPKQYITTTRIMDMSPEPSFPQCQWDTMGARHIQVCLGVRPGINQLHNDPSAGVNPKDIFHDHQR